MLTKDIQAIFRTYDIRGIVGETLDAALMRDIGRALAEEVILAYPSVGHHEIAVGWDGRLSAGSLSRALIDGLKHGGAHVRTLGMLPTPATYLAAHEFTGENGVMITGSHNPSEYNGCKMMIAGETLAAERIEALRDRISKKMFIDRSGGTESSLDFLEHYRSRIVENVPLSRPLRIIVDCGNGVTGVMVRTLFTAMGCSVDVLFEEIDGRFPNHHPDPSHEKNLVDIRAKITASRCHQPFDVGLAFDGDGDRVGVITPQGQVFAGDQLLMLFAEHMLPDQPGATVLYDVKCSSQVATWIRQHGGIPQMTHTGHALIKRAIRQTGAKLAGEMSGHIFFNDCWPGFDDAVYAAARLLQILAKENLNLDEWLAQFPKWASTPELNITCGEGEAHALVAQMQKNGQFDDAQINSIDGIRAEFPFGFGLVRASNTTPVLVLRFEAIDPPSLKHIQAVFARELRRCKPNIRLPF